MTATITLGTSSIAPTLVLGHSSKRDTGNRIHQIIGRAEPDVTFGPASLRKGTLQLFFLDEATANNAVEFHAQLGIFALTDTDLPTTSMHYVTNGAIAAELDSTTRLRWVVSVEYQEVLA